MQAIDEVIDIILEKHTNILDSDKQIIETYNINKDIEIGIHQTRDRIYMYAYSYNSDRNISIESNFKKLYNGFKKVAKDKHISKKNGYTYTLTLAAKKDDNIKIVKHIKEDPQMQLSEMDQLKLYISELENKVQKLIAENEQLKKNQSIKVKNERGAGRKSRFRVEEITDIKQLRSQGETISNIANKYDCSVGLIHKLINEN